MMKFDPKTKGINLTERYSKALSEANLRSMKYSPNEMMGFNHPILQYYAEEVEKECIKRCIGFFEQYKNWIPLEKMKDQESFNGLEETIYKHFFEIWK